VSAVNCSDGDLCTEDKCDEVEGCVFPEVDCDDGDGCTKDSCEPGIGCVYEEKDCDDSDECTEDSCESTSGDCFYTPVVCDDEDECTIDSCDSKNGCHFKAIANCTKSETPEEPDTNTQPKTGLDNFLMLLEDLLGAKTSSVSKPVIISVGVFSVIGIILFCTLCIFLLYRAHPPKAEGKYFAL